MASAEQFARQLLRHCPPAQIAKVRERHAEGWAAFKLCGTVSAPIVLLSKDAAARSNVASAREYCRVYAGGEVVRYTPSRGR